MPPSRATVSVIPQSLGDGMAANHGTPPHPAHLLAQAGEAFKLAAIVQLDQKNQEQTIREQTKREEESELTLKSKSCSHSRHQSRRRSRTPLYDQPPEPKQLPRPPLHPPHTPPAPAPPERLALSFPASRDTAPWIL